MFGQEYDSIRGLQFKLILQFLMNGCRHMRVPVTVGSIEDDGVVLDAI